MHAFLITCATKDQRLDYLAKKQTEHKVSALDAVVLGVAEGETIGIASVRDFQRQLILSPYNSPMKMGMVHDAHLLTVEAQNALLKTLEEPPGKTLLFLESPNPDALLPTIVSRCSLVNLGSATTDDATDAIAACVETLQQMNSLPIGKRMIMVDEIAKTRDDAKRWVELAIICVRHVMLQHYGIGPNSILYTLYPIPLLRSLLTARAQLAANVTPKLVLDRVFLSL